MRRLACWALLACALGAACGAGAAPRAPTPVAISPAASGQATGGWRLTVYYTPVESYHGPPLRAISDCAGAALGQHSADFLDHVRTEGYGRVVTPVRGARYLGWDFDRGCWIMASTPVGADDRPLRAWASTAAPATIASGTGVRVVACGSGMEPATCALVRGAAWVVDDRCAEGCADPRHLDLYIGEEDRPDFEDESPGYFDARGAVVALLG